MSGSPAAQHSGDLAAASDNHSQAPEPGETRASRLRDRLRRVGGGEGQHAGKKDPGAAKPSADGARPTPEPKHKKDDGKK
ncbi:hypothetical protein [Kitasatospora sp. NPDC088548]|uniref:hypothetical protein n=1 Tax=Kitasatospora sp. NPDC088548 TaxID=3364075 RepID=UPI003812C0E3